MPYFSVIIPTYNRATLLGRTLESVRQQIFLDYELIGVDDGSTEDTSSVFNAYQVSKVLQQNNRGPGASRNLGALNAGGRYLAFLDSDDVWFPWTLESYRSVIKAQSEPAIVVGKPCRFRNEAELVGVGREQVDVRAFPDYFASSAEWPWWGVSSFVIRADVFRACGGFAEQNVNGEDADLIMKLGVAKQFIQFVSPVTFGYREHGHNVTKDLTKTLAGTWLAVDSERAGSYPGGTTRALERWRILSRHIRPVTLGCVRAGRRGDAWRLYRATLWWHIALRRWKYLFGFPLKALSPGA